MFAFRQFGVIEIISSGCNFGLIIGVNCGILMLSASSEIRKANFSNGFERINDAETMLRSWSVGSLVICKTVSALFVEFRADVSATVIVAFCSGATRFECGFPFARPLHQIADKCSGLRGVVDG